MCCCGDGLPGNAGAYVKKSITVAAGDTMTGQTGHSCYAHDLCFSGCSEQSEVCWITAANVYVQEVVMVGNLCVQQDHHYFVVLEHKVSVTQNATTTTAE